MDLGRTMMIEGLDIYWRIDAPLPTLNGEIAHDTYAPGKRGCGWMDLAGVYTLRLIDRYITFDFLADSDTRSEWVTRAE